MINQVKKKIKGIRPVYQVLLWLLKFFVAVRSVRLDVSSLREFVAWTTGGQELGENNYRFIGILRTVPCCAPVANFTS